MRRRDSGRGTGTKTRGAKSSDSKGNGKKLDCFEFGRQLLETNDLDPVYVVLWEAQMDQDELLAWLLPYWCFYDMGTASYIYEGYSHYWTRMRIAAGSKDYPRGRERRHFRGKNAKESVAYLAERGLPSLYRPLLQPHPVLKSRITTLEGVMKEIARWRGFGPWIGFKIADMLERLDLAPIEFSVEGVFLFDSPKKGAETLREELGEDIPDEEVNSWAVSTILGVFSNKKYLAPPRYERGLGPQEAETVLCKWKSYLGGHYRVGEDIEACRNSLKRFLRCKTSQRLLKAGKKGGLW